MKSSDWYAFLNGCHHMHLKKIVFPCAKCVLKYDEPLGLQWHLWGSYSSVGISENIRDDTHGKKSIRETYSTTDIDQKLFRDGEEQLRE